LGDRVSMEILRMSRRSTGKNMRITTARRMRNAPHRNRRSYRFAVHDNHKVRKLQDQQEGDKHLIHLQKTIQEGRG
jgi:hypothetical protein